MKANADDDELARKIAERLHSREGTSKAWDVKLEEAGAGWSRCSMRLRKDMLNGHGTAHGGMIFALADTAFAWACNSRNVVTFAQHASISFLSPGKLGERLTAEARKDATEGRTGIYTVKVTGDDGRAVAIFQGLSRTAGGLVIEEEK
ncbi:hydroxyphenylacetyl-CoA thioesterase PaaI [Hyphococcus flavus]|uniref:Hydroxyphenylacetyl-CoA thioesterase PaaI n=1 Tax=Hyphococcus flavus TaxID=1866326 RepID=A0AAE9ZDJ8_9PROT|nr:hydroxyphenylacetyl-CoA thioesterase PaaI [Hyphococcus flavus]WDI30678.1 hydroxyphenylacetyl-CoA thioesterase PaaI [Hyphococcus flavus]